MMRKICKTVITVLLMLTMFLLFLSAVGCQNLSNNSSSSLPFESSFPSISSSSIEDSSTLFDRPKKDIHFRFVNPIEYKHFYKDFTTNNTERYFMPRTEIGEVFDSVLHHVIIKDVDSIELEQKNYRTDFPSEQTVWFTFHRTIKDKADIGEEENSEEHTGCIPSQSVSCTGICYDISAYNFDFKKETISLVCTQRYGTADDYEIMYSLRIGEVVLCDLVLSGTNMDLQTYEQEMLSFTQLRGYIA